MKSPPNSDPALPDADALRRARVDRWLSFALIAQWYASLAYAWRLPSVSPGLFSDLVHGPTFATGVAGGICTILPLLAARRWPGERITALAFSFCLSLISLLWLRLDAGGMEMYLTMLACLAALSLYRSPNLLMVGSTLFILHHAVCLAFPAVAPPGFTVTLAAEHAVAVLGTLLLLGQLIRTKLSPDANRSHAEHRDHLPPRVLVVESDSGHRTATVAILQKLGCHADQAKSGREAVEAIDGTRYDAVFMDCEMPVLSGYDATVEIRRRERGVRHTWIIALTSNAHENERDICLVVGMDDYLTKPARMSQIKQALKRSPAGRWLASLPGRPTVARTFNSRPGVQTSPPG